MDTEQKSIIDLITEPVTPAQPLTPEPESKPVEAAPLPPLPPQPPAEFVEIPAKPVNVTELLGNEPVPPVNQINGSPQPETTDQQDQRRGRGRPPGSRNRNRTESYIPEQSEIIPQADYVMMADMVFESSTNSLAMLFGPEWQAQNPQEKAMVCGALVGYLKAKQVKDIPPGMMLTIVLCAYSAPRLRQPSTAGKLKMAFLWVRNKFSKKKTPIQVLQPI